MKVKNFIRGLAVVACAAVSSTSFAGLITDTVNLNNQRLNSNQSTAWTHNLNDNGFELGSALSGVLTINLKDDGDSLNSETAGVTVELDWNLVDLFLGGNDDGQVNNPWFSQTFNYSTGLSFTSLLNLNEDGYLNVVLQSLSGDFLAVSSVLEVRTRDAAVPEPTSLALLAAGMIGIVMMRRNSTRA